MEYSSKTISYALIKTIAQTGKNDLEKFLVQQNIIQFELMLLVRLRSTIPDKDFLGWLEDRTLGQLIHLYKICVATKEEVPIINLLKEYNQKRNYLVHNILKDCDYKKLKSEVKIANKKGLEIIKYLEKLTAEELSRLKQLITKGK